MAESLPLRISVQGEDIGSMQLRTKQPCPGSWHTVKSWVPRGTCPAYFCLLVPRVQATVSHNHEED
jgi:hypothetical protein